MATSTFTCDCCECQYVRQLIDCCTSSAVPISVCEGIGGIVGVRYNDRCYTTDSSTTARATALTNGWDIVPLEDFYLTESGCASEDCYKYWQVLHPDCGNTDTDWVAPAYQLAGPCTTIPETSGKTQIGGRWYSFAGYRAQPICDADFTGGWGDYGGGYEYFEIISSTCFTDAGDPYECCGRCYDHTGVRFEGTPEEEAIDFARYVVLPCCVTISGMSFSGCGTPTGTTWDGKVTANGSPYQNSYSAAQSYGDPDCVGNWDMSNGYVPGTTTGLPGTNILYYNCDTGYWQIDLAFVSYEKSGPEDDPTGTYNRIGGATCGAPATLTVS